MGGSAGQKETCWGRKAAWVKAPSVDGQLTGCLLRMAQPNGKSLTTGMAQEGQVAHLSCRSTRFHSFVFFWLLQMCSVHYYMGCTVIHKVRGTSTSATQLEHPGASRNKRVSTSAHVEQCARRCDYLRDGFSRTATRSSNASPKDWRSPGLSLACSHQAPWLAARRFPRGQ